ncbi:penicillin-binding protein 1A [Chitinimonas naiadis]
MTSTPPDAPLPASPTGWRKYWRRFRLPALFLLLGLFMLAVASITWLMRDLPSLDELDNLQPKVPLRIYSSDNVLIGEFGRERRQLVKLKDMPAHLKQAVLDIEDARFYEHGAIDLTGALRAGLANLSSGGASQGASTITMQLSRDLFLTRDKNFTRKLREILLSYKIEAVRSKDEVLELYLNQIYLGQRAYGFAAAARAYFGKDLKEISLAEAAMLAGLPKAPAAYNPVVNPDRARIRQVYILKRMLELGHIKNADYQRALAEPLKLASGKGSSASPHAEYLAEMVRQQMVAQYGESAYARGLSVITTVDYTTQLNAWQAVRDSLLDYDRKRGYRGPEGFVKLPVKADDQADVVAEALETHPDADELTAAVVIALNTKAITLMTRDGETRALLPASQRFAATGLRADAAEKLRIKPGAIVRFGNNAQGKPELSQLPEVQGALVSVQPQDGAIRALIGGFDFRINPFNRVVQAWRQPGSSFKPFVYSAALEKGIGPATVVNDAPMSIRLDPNQDQLWQPKNDDGSVAGPITLRRGLQKSKNLVALRVLQQIGVPYARDYVSRFGFDPKQVPPYLPMALGAGQVTPLQLARGYTVFANGGYLVRPYLIQEVRDGQGKLLMQARPVVAEQNAPRVISAANAYIMDSLLTGVAQHGTAYQSNSLGRTDLAGKTGTTNDAHDGWFAGYQHSLVTVSWFGFDQPRSLGNSGAGAQLALPMWMRFMGQALKGVPKYENPLPEGVVNLGGELYLAGFTPGNGFIAGVGMEGVPIPGSEPVPTDEPEEEAEEAPPETPQAAVAPAQPMLNSRTARDR